MGMNCPSCHHPAHEPGKCRGATKQIVCDCKGGEPQEQPRPKLYEFCREERDMHRWCIQPDCECSCHSVKRGYEQQITALQRKLKERDELIEMMLRDFRDLTFRVERDFRDLTFRVERDFRDLTFRVERVLKEKP